MTTTRLLLLRLLFLLLLLINYHHHFILVLSGLTLVGLGVLALLNLFCKLSGRNFGGLLLGFFYFGLFGDILGGFANVA